jgi:hypothetical protein
LLQWVSAVRPTFPARQTESFDDLLAAETATAVLPATYHWGGWALRLAAGGVLTVTPHTEGADGPLAFALELDGAGGVTFVDALARRTPLHAAPPVSAGASKAQSLVRLDESAAAQKQSLATLRKGWKQRGPALRCACAHSGTNSARARVRAVVVGGAGRRWSRWGWRRWRHRRRRRALERRGWWGC